MSKLRWLMQRLLKTLWVRVSLFAVTGVVVAILASFASRIAPGRMPLDVSVDAIDSLLTIIASSMLAVTTFSIGALTAAYGSATANGTPRASQLLTEDRGVQNSLSTFVGSFLFSIVALIALKVSVYGPEGRAVLFIVTIGVIILIVISLLRWINQLTRLGRVSDTAERIEVATWDSMQTRLALPYLGGQRLAPDATAREGAVEVRSEAIGYVNFIEASRLQEIAEAVEGEIDVLVLPGSFVYRGTLLATISSGKPVPEGTQDDVIEAFSISGQRNYDQDPRFGLIVMSEVALRALSEGVNDHGTAIDIIGRLTRLLSDWGRGLEEAKDADPIYPRVRVRALETADLYEDAFSLVGRDGADQVDVVLRLVKSLAALCESGPEECRAAARVQLRLAVERARATLDFADDKLRLEEAVAGLKLSV